MIKLRNDIAPQHAARLKQLAREGFYNGVPFHRVIAGFMAQTGDGQNGNGTGGSKYPDLKAEFSNVPFKRGTVGMARKGNSNDSANSQWFICFGDASFLNGQYTVGPGRLLPNAILLTFIVAAVITPTGDMVTQTIFAAPMVGLYLLSILIAWIVRPRQEQ